MIPRAQEELLHNVFDFADREAGDIMVPALDVDWLEAGLTAEVALDRIVHAPHERYPVGHGSLDHLDGVVHVRDLLAGARRQGATTVGELARPVLGVPETKDLGALLRELREQRAARPRARRIRGRRGHRHARRHPRRARGRDQGRVRSP